MDTLLLQQHEVSSLLSIDDCMTAVENAFCLHARGKTVPPKVLAMHCDDGGFHIKAGMLELKGNYFVAKMNANFPGNPRKNGLPTIQGVAIVCNADSGEVLALMDSIQLTIIRTGAATGVAAKYLSVKNATTATICGCGNQGRISLKALLGSRNLHKVFAFDTDRKQVESYRVEFANEVEVIPVSQRELSAALQESQIVVTCTPSKKPFVNVNDITPGTFIAAIGADNEEKTEIFPELLASNKVVTDITDQCISIGELHHAIENKLMAKVNVHAELGEIIANIRPGRISNEEIIIFDSTGTGLQDVAAASILYERAMAKGVGRKFNFSANSNSSPKLTNKYQRAIKALKRWYPFK